MLGTAITKLCDTEIARTGLTEVEAAADGLDAVATVAESQTRAHYYPGSGPITVKLVHERSSRRLLGGQIVGAPGSGKRIDTIATALWAGLTVDDLVNLDLAYAPPFSPVWDPVNTAARRAELTRHRLAPSLEPGETHPMKLITAIVKPNKLDNVKAAMKAVGVTGSPSRRSRDPAARAARPRSTAGPSTSSTSCPR